MIIKAGNITNLTEARYFTSKGVHQLGFNFKANDPNAIAPLDAQQIINWIQGPELIAEFAGQDAKKMLEMVTVLNLKNMLLPISEYDQLPVSVEAEVILHAPIEELKPDFQSKHILQIKCSVGDLSRSERLNKLCAKNKVVLECDWQEDSLLKALDLPVYGINFNGSGEEKLGTKSFEAMDQLFELMEDEF